AELVDRLQKKLLAEGKIGPEWHEPSRPQSVEAEGTGRFSTFLENTCATGYVVHLSSEEALDVATSAKSRGVRIHIESVVPHLLLDKTYAERPGVEGMKHVMSPPLAQGTINPCSGGHSRAPPSTPSAPITARSIFRRNSLARIPSSTFPTAFPA